MLEEPRRNLIHAGDFFLQRKRKMKSYKPYRTEAQKLLALKLARKQPDGAYRSPAPFSLPNQKGEFIWGKHKHPLHADTKKPLIGWQK